VGDNILIDSETLFVTDFVNLKIKSAQSFEGAYNNKICVHIFIEMSDYTYINIYIYTVFLKKHATCYSRMQGPTSTGLLRLES
jgi:hypothetical protein